MKASLLTGLLLFVLISLAAEEKKEGVGLNSTKPELASQKLMKKLDEIVIDHVEFEEEQYSKLVKYLDRRSKDLDPEKTGVDIEFKYFPDSNRISDGAQDKKFQIDDPESSITALADDVPLREVIRSFCHATGLKAYINGDKLILTNKDMELKKLEMAKSSNEAIRKKLKEIQFDSLNIENGSFRATMSLFFQRMQEMDPSVEKTGLGLMFRDSGISEKKINMKFNEDRSVEEVFKEISKSAGLEFIIDPYFVVFSVKEKK